MQYDTPTCLPARVTFLFKITFLFKNARSSCHLFPFPPARLFSASVLRPCLTFSPMPFAGYLLVASSPPSSTRTSGPRHCTRLYPVSSPPKPTLTSSASSTLQAWPPQLPRNAISLPGPLPPTPPASCHSYQQLLLLPLLLVPLHPRPTPSPGLILLPLPLGPLLPRPAPPPPLILDMTAVWPASRPSWPTVPTTRRTGGAAG